MAKNLSSNPPIMFVRYHDGFTEVDWMMPVDGAFGLVTPVEGMYQEANAKGMAVIVQASLVPLEHVFGSSSEGESNGDE